ncbi:hypothetical protein BGC07_15425 [Piscirickettsia litoralis]|uniref:Uncharacterized protein n=1 Tax=Piscirickettsia litoralis TaxID=1891921 RepID=A0ABX2ZYN5_9GAMM|nr:hypothetical protein BGC07_15425 [Piscirickettsia litoralis]
MKLDIAQRGEAATYSLKKASEGDEVKFEFIRDNKGLYHVDLICKIMNDEHISLLKLVGVPCQNYLHSLVIV